MKDLTKKEYTTASLSMALIEIEGAICLSGDGEPIAPPTPPTPPEEITDEPVPPSYPSELPDVS